MSTSNESSTNSEALIKLEQKGLLRRSFKSSTKSLSLKPRRSFGRVKSLRPKAALCTKKEIGETEDN